MKGVADMHVRMQTGQACMYLINTDVHADRRGDAVDEPSKLKALVNGQLVSAHTELLHEQHPLFGTSRSTCQQAATHLGYCLHVVHAEAVLRTWTSRSNTNGAHCDLRPSGFVTNLRLHDTAS